MKAVYKPLDSETARRSHAGTSFDPERRGEQEIEYHKETFEKLSIELGDFFEQKHADKLRDLWTLYLCSHAAVMSSMITGPARFPVASNQKKSGWADNHYQAIFKYCDDLERWKRKADKRQAVENAGGELAMKRAELEAAQAWHETMKKANAIIRKAFKAEKEITEATREALRGLSIDPIEVEKICIPNCFGGYGYESFSLTNSNARIKGMTARVAILKRIEANKTSGAENEVFRIEGGTVTYDLASNRINVNHDEKPERATIDIIKGYGFRWSRNFGTWTRQMTPNAKCSAELLVKRLNK